MTRRSAARIAADNAKLDADLAAFWADIERQNADDFLDEQEAMLDAYYEDIALEAPND